MNNSTIEKPIVHSIAFLVSIITFNALLSVTATLFNFVIILTFIKTPSLRSPCNILILNLAVTDFGVGAVVQPVYCAMWIGILTENGVVVVTAFNTLSIIGIIFIFASYFTITAITLDRFLAVYLHLRYKELVTTKRATLALIPVWVVSISCCIIAQIFKKSSIVDTILHTINYSTLVLNIALMLKISRVVRKHTKEIRAQTFQGNQGEIVTMKKSVNIMYCIVGVFFLCYFPYYCVSVAVSVMDVNSALVKAGHAFQTILFANSSINPVIYFWRIKDMRNAAAKLLQCMRRHDQQRQQQHRRKQQQQQLELQELHDQI